MNWLTGKTLTVLRQLILDCFNNLRIDFLDEKAQN
jgi:hypothetical protein